MVLYRDLGDRPFPWELWSFLRETIGPGPLMVRFGRFGRASFCVLVRQGLFRRLDWSGITLWGGPLHDWEVVRVCRFTITKHVNFKYWFIWPKYESLSSWIAANCFGYRAVNWPMADKLRRDIVGVFQRACRLPALDANAVFVDVGRV